MLDFIARFGQSGLNTMQKMGNSGLFLLRVLYRKPDFARLWPDLRTQLYFVGVLSCLIIVVSALFIGMVVGLQGYNTLEKFGASSQLGQLLALSVVRELGPVIGALLFAGRAGSALTAEIGLMKATEQLASMDMMGIDPLSRIVYPRFLAGIIALPLLTLIFSAVAIYGGYFIGVEWLGVDSGSFWSNMQASVNFHADVLSGIIKSIVFAVVVIWIAVFQGFTCVPTAEGISQATTRTVVFSSLAVLGFDFLLTAMMIGDW
ncbi:MULTISPECIES: lipid asymmetry maintenance ABC transporter permease subunit MlaE [Legionella]|uniref:Intermembrane phospholipid transport system permease protein MlaE n=1 Tax=Legionella septentrionalis TaxID=2498109 RepID=A0A3S0VAJ6_9GAMM|nr:MULTISPECIES: lipid asymmetry maintenance ABC transporter permease subunit MlaE [Legionella]MCP0913582.1 lipid asymmetry maintenance ABC transporter permease subunit MlaE [Legionella sp. 27cVA30]RUQ88229.1 lipid asymmetry maintenance ABC transporter permease subunit MlaE [Legionella septentrionalis]RUQ97471.1 lipid asymmetry maintenance ABC transporter permease subunit MlaE [Legionella septentrionalis]RUR09767.1 lipid asymmetry maintenance ABC transporter permease subunit MlaE [Legionella se